MRKILLILLFVVTAWAIADENMFGLGGSGGGTTDSVARANATNANDAINNHKTDTGPQKHITESQKDKLHDPVTLDAASSTALTLTGQELKLTLPASTAPRTTFQAVPTDTDIVSEKLVKDSLGKKIDKPVAITQGYIATVDATGNNVEYKAFKASLANHILRPNGTENVAPDPIEHPDPKKFDTAIILLNNGLIEYWTHDGASWLKDYSKSDSTTNQYVGIGATFATMPATRKDVTALVSGDRAWLASDDGANLQGMYFTDGAAWSFGYTFDTGIATRVFETLALATAATIQPNQIIIVGTPSSNYAGTWVHAGATAKLFATNDSDFVMIAKPEVIRYEIWSENTAFVAGAQVIALDPDSSSPTYNTPRIYKAKIPRPDTVLLFDVPEKGSWDDVGGAMLNGNSGVYQYTDGTQYSPDAFNSKALVPTFFESIDDKERTVLINANTTFGKNVFLDGVLQAKSSNITQVSVKANSFMLYRDYEDVNSISGATRIRTFGGVSNPDLVSVEDEREVIIDFGSPKGAYQVANFTAPLPTGVTWADIKDKYESLEVYVTSNSNWGYRATAKKIDNIEIGLEGVYHTLDATYHGTTDYNIIVSFNATGLQSGGTNNRVRNVRVYGIKKRRTVIDPSLATVPAGYEVQLVTGTFDANASKETIVLAVPAGKVLLKEPEIELMNPAPTVFMIGANYHMNATAGGLAWRWQQYMETPTKLVVESKGSEVVSSAYQMTLTFVNQ